MYHSLKTCAECIAFLVNIFYDVIAIVSISYLFLFTFYCDADKFSKRERLFTSHQLFILTTFS